MNKSLLINLVALLLIAVGFFMPISTLQHAIFYTGLFAFSGAITNQIAIHMLFEKVPGLYGSGVIVLQFEAFKIAIKNMMMEQFFTKEQLDNFFKKEEAKLNLTPIIEETDFSPAFDALSKTVMESPFGGMLGMFGGESAIENLREPFTQKMRSAIIQITESDTFNTTLQQHLQGSTLSDDILVKIESVITSRLDELTPEMVKELIQNLIREHLGWLVVWGGVFGGLIGLVSSFLV